MTSTPMATSGIFNSILKAIPRAASNRTQQPFPLMTVDGTNPRADSEARARLQATQDRVHRQHLSNLNSYSQQAGIPNPTGLPSLRISPNPQPQVDPNRIPLGGGMMGDPNYYVSQNMEMSPSDPHYIPPSPSTYDPYAPIDKLPTFNPNPTQPGTGGGGGQTPGGGQASGPFDYNTIDHADIPGVLKERGQIGLPGYQQLVDFGHTEENLRKVFQGLPDVARTPELNAFMRDNALGILNTKGPFNLRTMDHANIPDVLKQQGTLTQAGYNQLVEHGHPETLLRMSIRDAGIDVGNNLANYIDKNPMGILAQREFERGPVNPLAQEGLGGGGRGVSMSSAQLESAFESAPFAFESNKMLKRGYSFMPGEGRVLISSSSYRGDDGFNDGIINIYGPASPQTGEGPGGPIDQTGNNQFGETPSTPVTPVDPPNPGINLPYMDPAPVIGTPGPGTGTPGPGGGGGPSYNDQMADLLNRITDLATANPFADLPPYVAPPAPVYQAPNYTFNVPDPAAGPSYQMFGAQGSSVPGVKIKRSNAKRTLMNTLGTGFFNRGTRPTLRISNLNV